MSQPLKSRYLNTGTMQNVDKNNLKIRNFHEKGTNSIDMPDKTNIGLREVANYF
jgi:hypothetical protein